MQYWNQDGVYSLVSPDKKVVLDVRFFDDGEVMTRKTILAEQYSEWIGVKVNEPRSLTADDIREFALKQQGSE